MVASGVGIETSPAPLFFERIIVPAASISMLPPSSTVDTSTLNSSPNPTCEGADVNFRVVASTSIGNVFERTCTGKSLAKVEPWL